MNRIAAPIKQLDELSNAAKEVGLKFNVVKTKYISYNISSAQIDNPGSVLQDKLIRMVNDIKCLGSMMASSESDIRRRL